MLELSARPLELTSTRETRGRGYELVRAEHGWVLSTSGAAVTVRRRLEQEVLVPKQTRFLLEEGDVLWAHARALVLSTAPEHREPELERQAVSAWESAAPWSVLADRLLEHGDPLGELITAGARSTRPLAPHTWVGTEWRHGLLRRVCLGRPEWMTEVPWREALLEILSSRASRFLEEISLDLSRIEPEANAKNLALELLQLPWPRWLVRLRFGVANEVMVVPPSVIDRSPQLERAPLFSAGERARLVLERVADDLEVEGLSHDAVELAEGLRLRVFPNRVLLERPAWPRYDSWPSWDFAFHDGRWFMTWRHGAPRSDEVRINGMEFFNAALAPGDRLEVMQRLGLRFETD